MPAEATREPLVCVAAVVGVHGLRGALKLRCFTAEPENVAAYGPVHDEDGNPLFALRVVRPIDKGVLVKAEGVTNRTVAEAYRGKEFFVPRSALPAPEEDEFYHEDLVGLAVRDAAGAEIGRVRALFDFGGGDIIEVALDDGRSLSLPFTREAVPVIDVAAGHVVIEPPAELTGAPR
ncbi:ribosome maturation factor RimM [Marinivivus vitaminiproducens]|uniref:ribosome maturation factor RimM n=1 Tax=Marinivivus vitaminiproducens TaxID=3035935 RepID=UPI0027A11C26|nr:ribosome maturation factor RimM [Geminicoccaceae bacterium SCSIO 64248]